MVGLRSRAKFELIMLRRSKSTYEVKILDEEFPKNHILLKIFNRSTVKISYSCMPNLRQKINAHNKSILHSTHDLPKSCNCREPSNCPLNGNCLQSSVIYQATVETNDNKPSQTYIGLTENSFKTRFTNRRNPFKDHKKKLSTELSKHVWKILKHAASYNPVSERCNLCLWEKYFIIFRPEQA